MAEYLLGLILGAALGMFLTVWYVESRTGQNWFVLEKEWGP